MEKNKQQLLIALASVIVISASIFLIYKAKFSNKQSAAFDQEMQMQQAQSDSTELDSIEKDVEDTDLKSIDKELDDIETEINSVYQ